MAPIGMNEVPRIISFLWSNLTLMAPINRPITIETTLDTVPSWLMMATKAGSEEPRNSPARSRRYTCESESTIYNEKEAKVKERTKNLPTENCLSSVFCCNLTCLQNLVPRSAVDFYERIRINDLPQGSIAEKKLDFEVHNHRIFSFVNAISFSEYC